MFKSNTTILIALIAALPFVACSDDDDSVRPEPCTHCIISLAPSQDNTLYEDDQGTVSNGAGGDFFAGFTRPGGREQEPPLIRRALIEFDIERTGIPAGSTIDSVFLDLTVTRTNPLTGEKSFSLHRVLSAWGEGASKPLNLGGGGADADIGDATWIHTFFPTGFWSTPGGDFDPSPSATAVANLEGVRYRWGSTAEMVADVQAWLDKPSTNFGWTIVGEEQEFGTTKRFASRENVIVSSRPGLQIHYTVP